MNIASKFNRIYEQLNNLFFTKGYKILTFSYTSSNCHLLIQDSETKVKYKITVSADLEEDETKDCIKELFTL